MVDLNFSKLNRYEYSLIQYCPLKTFEILNIGVILKDVDSGKLEFKKIKHFKDLTNCFSIEDIDAVEFALETMSFEIENNSLFEEYNISNSIYITAPNIYMSKDGFEDTLNNVFQSMLSIKGAHKNLREINTKDKLHIMRGIKEEAEKKNYRFIKFRQQLKNAHRRVDAVTYIDKKPTAVMEISSPYSSDFMQNFALSTLVLQELAQNKTIKEKIMYLPILATLSAELRKKFESAKRISKDINNFHFIDTSDYGEVIGIMNELTKKYRH